MQNYLSADGVRILLGFFVFLVNGHRPSPKGDVYRWVDVVDGNSFIDFWDEDC